MAFENATASGVADLMSKLSTFAVANGWTDRALTTASSLGLSNSSGDDQVEVQFRWIASNATMIAIYQSVDFDVAATAPGSHTNDSGNGYVPGTFNETNIITERWCQLADATMEYWFFEDAPTNPVTGGTSPYIHVVVEAPATGQFVHFGFGCLKKFNDWTGGAYCYGWRRDPTANSNSGVVNTGTFLLDGRTDQTTGPDMEPYVATLHMEGGTNQVASGKWGLVWGNGSDANAGTDGDAIAREPIAGGFRGGLLPRSFGRQAKDPLTSQLGGYPIGLWYRDNTPATDEVEYLGSMEAVLGCNMANYTAKQELVNGSDTWVVFPAWRRVSSGGDTNDLGILYKKVS